MPTELAMPASRQSRSVTARFLCDRCGAIAATVTLTPPGARNPLAPPDDDDRGMLLTAPCPSGGPSRSMGHFG